MGASDIIVHIIVVVVVVIVIVFFYYCCFKALGVEQLWLWSRRGCPQPSSPFPGGQSDKTKGKRYVLIHSIPIFRFPFSTTLPFPHPILDAYLKQRE